MQIVNKRDYITIERKGKPLARIMPPEDTCFQGKQNDQVSSKQRALLEELNSLPVITTDKDPVATLRSIREQKRTQASDKYGK